jgi:hypothetical protein
MIEVLFLLLFIDMFEYDKEKEMFFSKCELDDD